MVKIIQSYTLLEQIGEGEYGKVFRGVDSRNGKEVAVKVIHARRFKENPKLQQCTLNEIEVLTKIDSPYIVRFIEILKTINNFYFFYEYCNGGTLDQEIKKYGHLSEYKIYEYLEQLLEAFRILIANNIMHRDLKPSNIMLHNGKIKLGDFGFCKSLQSQRDLAQTMLGSPIYMAPEILKGQIYTIKADIWSLGVVIYEMAFGFCPYEESSIAKLINVLDNQELVINHEINPISQQLEALLKKCLVKDHFKRITWDELLNFPIRPPKTDSNRQSNSHQRALSQYNRTNKRESDLTFDKGRKVEENKFFKKKTPKPDQDYQSQQLHRCFKDIIKTIDSFINENCYPQITLFVAFKCYKMIERQHRRLGTKYLKERIDLTEAVIQIETLLEEEEKSFTDDTILSIISEQLQPKKIDILAKLLKAVDLNQNIILSELWTRNFQRNFYEAGLISNTGLF